MKCVGMAWISVEPQKHFIATIGKGIERNRKQEEP